MGRQRGQRVTCKKIVIVGIAGSWPHDRHLRRLAKEASQPFRTVPRASLNGGTQRAFPSVPSSPLCLSSHKGLGLRGNAKRSPQNNPNTFLFCETLKGHLFCPIFIYLSYNYHCCYYYIFYWGLTKEKG